MIMWNLSCKNCRWRSGHPVRKS